MASPIIGTVLTIALTFSLFAVALPLSNPYEKNSCEALGMMHDYYDDTSCSILKSEYAEKCRCTPPTNPDGSLCEPVSLPDRFAVAWRCDLKPKTGGY